MDPRRRDKLLGLIVPPSLGDAIRWSNMARLYRFLGYRVAVAKDISGMAKETEAYDLVITKNPYIAGEIQSTEADIVAGCTRTDEWNWITPIDLSNESIPEEERIFRLHYEPCLLPELKDAVVLDLGMSSYRMDYKGRDDFSKVDSYVNEHYEGAVQIKRYQHSAGSRDYRSLPVTGTWETLPYFTIYELCDIVASCKKYVCLQTGSEYIGACYASAIECLITEKNKVSLTCRSRGVYRNRPLKMINLYPNEKADCI